MVQSVNRKSTASRPPIVVERRRRSVPSAAQRRSAVAGPVLRPVPATAEAAIPASAALGLTQAAIPAQPLADDVARLLAGRWSFPSVFYAQVAR